MDWWKDLLDTHARSARSDCEDGVYEPPYPGSDDPQDQEENYAYEHAWHQRRHQLKGKFKWKK